MDDNQQATEKDHKQLGKELDLFVFSELVGPGLPLWTPRGTTLRTEVDNFVQEMRTEHGYEAVTIPHITKKDLYEKSGHWTKFKDDLFHVTSREGHEFAMKPMNCPHHTQIYASRPRSYRELPIRYRGTTMDYRDEQTGELNGLLRARSFTQDDAHVFCRENQILDEVLKIWDVIERFYGAFGFELSLRFSRRDPATPDAYAGDDDMWDRAEAELQKALDKHPHAELEDGVGEAAFYGPKLDFTAIDSLGRKWQVATIQVDFAQPEGLELTYVNEDGQEVRPVMIHCAIMGSIERFLAVYIEHTGGKFPVWLAPEQIRVATLNQEDNVVKAAEDILAKAKNLGLRASLDNASESVGKKIREAELMKVPYTLVIGNKELESQKIAPRVRGDLSQIDTELGVDEFLHKVAQDAKARQ